MANEIGYLLGVICGDGYLTEYHGKPKWNKSTNHYRTALEVKDKTFAEEFKEVLQKHTENKVQFHKRERIKKLNFKFAQARDRPRFLRTWRCRVNDKVLYLKLKGMKQNVKSSLASMSNENKRLFLRGFYQSEGCLTHARHTINLTNPNLELLQLIAEILKEFKVEISGIYKHPEAPGYSDIWRLGIYRQAEIAKFLDLVGSVGRGRGVTKIPIRLEAPRP